MSEHYTYYEARFTLAGQNLSNSKMSVVHVLKAGSEVAAEHEAQALFDAESTRLQAEGLGTSIARMEVFQVLSRRVRTYLPNRTWAA